MLDGFFFRRPVRRVFGLLALGLAAVLYVAPPVLAAGQAVVTDVRVGKRADTTRFVFEFDNEVTFRIFTLADPYRVVLDFPEVGWRLPGKPLPGRVGLLEKLRYGLFKPGNSRVVLDVRGPARVADVFLLKPSGAYRYRLVLDLVETSRESFLSGIRSGTGGPVVSAVPEAGTVVSQVAFTPFNAPPRKPRPRRRPKKRVVVIDPGHGGVDSGTVGVGGAYEKHITLSIARAIKDRLERTGGYRVVLTRDRDIFIRLRDRVAIARDAGADIFISIHADSIKNRSIRGLSIYTLSETASDREAGQLAEKENKADLIAGIDLSGETKEVTNILIDLAQRETMNQSARLAAFLVRGLKKEIRILRNGHRFAGFAVLKAPDVPSVLMETGFLSNSRDERALRSRDYRRKLAASIALAVGRYFNTVEEAYRK
ncbi:MAG TPA: N-acetylmuramoyl-L-alanine amidase [Rhodospirillales bacterium]|nr:N-acetylmuramoyl-L-alanine amidase [Rhodospirillales bacterium]